MTELYHDTQSYSFIWLPGNLMAIGSVVHSAFMLSPWRLSVEVHSRNHNMQRCKVWSSTLPTEVLFYRAFRVWKNS